MMVFFLLNPLKCLFEINLWEIEYFDIKKGLDQNDQTFPATKSTQLCH